jgi:DNA polymerase III delta prime subunit
MNSTLLNDQPFAVNLCRTWLKRQTTHPLLFFGPAGAGKKALALEVAKALNCKVASATLEQACGECLSCKKIDSGIHPDVRVIDLAWQALERKEPVEKQQTLRMETMLGERHRLLQSAVEGAWKVSIIHDAHRMTPDAANVLLKILEEPPARTALLLLTPYRDRLLATLISRSQPVRFRHVERAASLSHEEVEAHRQAENLWDSLKTVSPEKLVQTAEGRSRTVKVGRPDIEEHIHRLLVPATRALRSGNPQASKSVRVLERALTQLRHNVQPALVYDNLLLQLSAAQKNKAHS